jgi:hypothetical protein
MAGQAYKAAMKSLWPLLFACMMYAQLSAATQPALPADGKQSSGEWKTLFDGKTLAGWRSLRSEKPGPGWTVADGAITRTAASGDLLTTGEFGDFELSLEWKITEGANSGIIYRVGLAEEQTFHTGPEYQILDGLKAQDRIDPKHATGSLYDLVAPSADRTLPVGQWNQTRIIVTGWQVQHWLNGEKIIDIDLASQEGQALIAASKFRDMPNFAKLLRGHIALQDHDEAVSFRYIRIRELK